MSTVITGMGIISPFGLGKDTFWDSLLAGSSALSRVSSFDAGRPGSRLSSKKAGLIPDIDESEFLPSKTIKYLQRAEKLAIISSRLALSDAGIDSPSPGSGRLGIAIGSTASNLRADALFDRQVICGEAAYVDPSLVPSGIMNSLSGSASIANGIRGFHVPVAAGEASGLSAIHLALMEMEGRRVDLALAGGVEEICDELYLSYHGRKMLSGSDEAGGGEESLPFSGRRNGMVLSEAAALLALESRERAVERGAKIYAECAGSGFAFAPDAGADTERSIKAAVRAMEMACRDAGIRPRDVDFICASANGSVAGDYVEAEALRRLFGHRPSRPLVTSIKSMLGESLGASGALQVAASALAIHSSRIPRTINYDGGASDLNIACESNVEISIDCALANSFSGSGHKACLVLRKARG